MDYILVYHCKLCQQQEDVNYNWGDSPKDTPLCSNDHKMVRGFLPLTPKTINTSMVDAFVGHMKAGDLARADEAFIPAAEAAMISEDQELKELVSEYKRQLDRNVPNLRG